MVEGFDEAGVDVDWGDDSGVVSIVIMSLSFCIDRR